jgi:hypothetical protein
MFRVAIVILAFSLRGFLAFPGMGEHWLVPLGTPFKRDCLLSLRLGAPGRRGEGFWGFAVAGEGIGEQT